VSFANWLQIKEDGLDDIINKYSGPAGPAPAAQTPQETRGVYEYEAELDPERDGYRLGKASQIKWEVHWSSKITPVLKTARPASRTSLCVAVCWFEMKM